MGYGAIVYGAIVMASLATANRLAPAQTRGQDVSVVSRVSRRGESHPPPLSGPDVTVSRHPAPTVRPK
jgi:hypothetical protein